MSAETFAKAYQFAIYKAFYLVFVRSETPIDDRGFSQQGEAVGE